MRPIGISGVATSGKDTLCNKLTKKLLGTRIALADTLKDDIDPFLRAKTGISAWTQVAADKKLIRPMLVEYGRLKRIQSSGKYWTSLAEPKVSRTLSSKVTPIITDIRYDEYPEDEVWWLKEHLNGILIHVSRLDKNGNIVEPANPDEEENDAKVKAAAQYRIVWHTVDNMDELEPHIEWLVKRIRGL